jgi:hypothetical protein
MGALLVLLEKPLPRALLALLHRPLMRPVALRLEMTLSEKIRLLPKIGLLDVHIELANRRPLGVLRREGGRMGGLVGGQRGKLLGEGLLSTMGGLPRKLQEKLLKNSARKMSSKCFYKLQGKLLALLLRRGTTTTGTAGQKQMLHAEDFFTGPTDGFRLLQIQARLVVL